MSLTLSAVVTASRDRHPSFFRTRVTDAVLARYLADTQNELIAKAVIRDRQYLAQSAVVSVSLDSTVNGAGAGAGSPGTVDSLGAFTTTNASTGAVVEAGITVADGATVWITETPVTGATSTTTTKAAAARTVNADIGRVLVIVAGTGAGQRREVVSNTATVWTHAAWSTIPDSTSTFVLITPTLTTDDTAGAVTALPSTTSNQGYLVKLSAAGVPYIDYTTPLTATMEHGVPLPSMQALLPDLCQWWPANDTAPTPRPLWVTTAQRRFAPERFPAVYQVGDTLYLCGQSAEWTDVQSLELRYVPIAPVFTALTDLFLVPDAARPALVAKAAAFMALRVTGMSDVSIDPAPFVADSVRAERDYLNAVTNAKRGRNARVKEVW